MITDPTSGQYETYEDENRAIEVFQYPEAPWTEDISLWSSASARMGVFSEKSISVGGLEALEGRNRSVSGSDLAGGVPQASTVDEEWEGRIAAESCKAEERGRSQGLERGLMQGREEAMKEVATERDRLYEQGVALIQSFAEERGRYFHKMEQESVQLALAIAARILRREAQMDPLLLTGAVRVALGQLSQSTIVRLHVPTQDRTMWEEALGRMPGLVQRPRIVGDAELSLGNCRMETDLGSVDLGLWAQLKEIERGFFDRVAPRPPSPQDIESEDSQDIDAAVLQPAYDLRRPL